MEGIINMGIGGEFKVIRTQTRTGRNISEIVLGLAVTEQGETKESCRSVL